MYQFFKRQLKTPTCFGSFGIHPQGVLNVLHWNYLWYFVCVVGVWQREIWTCGVCVCCDSSHQTHISLLVLRSVYRCTVTVILSKKLHVGIFFHASWWVFSSHSEATNHFEILSCHAVTLEDAVFMLWRNAACRDLMKFRNNLLPPSTRNMKASISPTISATSTGLDEVLTDKTSIRHNLHWWWWWLWWWCWWLQWWW